MAVFTGLVGNGGLDNAVRQLLYRQSSQELPLAHVDSRRHWLCLAIHPGESGFIRCGVACREKDPPRQDSPAENSEEGREGRNSGHRRGRAHRISCDRLRRSPGVLSYGRMEDEIALRNLGLSNLSFFALSPEAFTVRGGLWFAIPGLLVAFLRDVIEMVAVNHRNPSEFKFSFGWVAWFAALFLMPKAISTLALIFLVIQLFTTLAEFIRGEAPEPG
jgi:hypothetical protein